MSSFLGLASEAALPLLWPASGIRIGVVLGGWQRAGGPRRTLPGGSLGFLQMRGLRPGYEEPLRPIAAAMCQGVINAVLGHEVFGRADLGFQVPACPMVCVAVGSLLSSLSVSSSVTLELSCLGVTGPAQSAPSSQR